MIDGNELKNMDLNEKIIDCNDEEIIKEKKIGDGNDMQTIKFNTFENLNQKTFFQIEFKIDGQLKEGTWFFCKIPDPNNNNKKIKVLITCYHVLNEFFKNKIVTIYYKYREGKTEYLNLENRVNCGDEHLDYACFQILEEDNIHDFLDIDENLILNNNLTENLKNKVINIFYTNEISLGTIKNITDEYFIYHNCDTKDGWSGSPISNNDNNLIIGIHQGGHPKKNLNKGLLIKSILLDMRNKNTHFKEENQE